jgi:hypothetical protein
MVQGVIAQLVERLHGMQEVGGSIPPGSTNLFKGLTGGAEAAKVPVVELDQRARLRIQGLKVQLL